MAHPHGDGQSICIARVEYGCLDHGRHVVFMASLDNLAHILAADLKSHHERSGMTVTVDELTLPRTTVRSLFTDDMEMTDDIPF